MPLAAATSVFSVVSMSHSASCGASGPGFSSSAQAAAKPTAFGESGSDG